MIARLIPNQGEWTTPQNQSVDVAEECTKSQVVGLLYKRFQKTSVFLQNWSDQAAQGV